MSSQYNLNELAGQDYFTMDLDGFIYRMSYPSAKDILKLDELGVGLNKDNTRLEEITRLMLEESDKIERIELTKEAKALKTKLSKNQTSTLDWCAGYIEPENPKAPDFKKKLMAKSVKYLLAFINIMQEELK